jgi:hypothetical protein
MYVDVEHRGRGVYGLAMSVFAAGDGVPAWDSTRGEEDAWVDDSTRDDSDDDNDDVWLLLLPGGGGDAG